MRSEIEKIAGKLFDSVDFEGTHPDIRNDWIKDATDQLLSLFEGEYEKRDSKS